MCSPSGLQRGQRWGKHITVTHGFMGKPTVSEGNVLFYYSTQQTLAATKES